MTPDIRDVKKAWRRAGAELFGLVNRPARRRLDLLLTERVKEYVFASGARKILAFSPLPDEPDLLPFLRHWLGEGGWLALPVWLGGEGCVLRRIEDVDAQLRPGRGGIMEPVGTLPEAAPGEIDLALAPGRFFSETCDRMGRGAGVYDALFRASGMKRVGVAYDFQVFPKIPVSESDLPVDLVLTPSRVIMKA